MKSQKGGEFERELCKRLSLWWTHGARDDVFWRSAASGGRATIRGRKGQQTYGQYGDIQAVDPIGSPLTQLCTIEAKRGYSSTSFADAIDKGKTMKLQPWEAFLHQARDEAAHAKTPYWMLIQRRDKREALVFIPLALWNQLRLAHCFHPRPTPCVMGQVMSSDKREVVAFVATLLSDFLEEVSPEIIAHVAGRR
jgi:hypothetical protein